jgi:hypothetical protein
MSNAQLEALSTRVGIPKGGKKADKIARLAAYYGSL